MVKIILKCLFTAVCLCGFSACADDKDEEVRQEALASPVFAVYFTVADAETGTDLLDPATECSLLEKVRITCNGKIYRYEGVDINAEVLGPYALRLKWGYLDKNRSGDPYCISFGQFHTDWHDCENSFLVDWGDGGAPTEVKFGVMYKNGTYNPRDGYTPYLAADGVSAVSAPLDGNRIPLLVGDVPVVGYFNDCWYISLTR